jgi:hypothetical protein
MTPSPVISACPTSGDVYGTYHGACPAAKPVALGAPSPLGTTTVLSKVFSAKVNIQRVTDNEDTAGKQHPAAKQRTDRKVRCKNSDTC